jgi:hypothetical protein
MKSPFLIFWFARAETSAGISSGVEGFPLSQDRMRAVVRFPRAFHSPTAAASAWSPLPAVQKKSWLETVSEPAQRIYIPYVRLVAVVVMIPMMTVVAVPVVV